MSDDDIVALLRHEIAQASSYQSANVSQQRIDALKYYMGDYYGDEVEEQSKVVTTEVRDTIESILPHRVVRPPHQNLPGRGQHRCVQRPFTSQVCRP